MGEKLFYPVLSEKGQNEQVMLIVKLFYCFLKSRFSLNALTL